jgi:hypothetical protein
MKTSTKVNKERQPFEYNFNLKLPTKVGNPSILVNYQFCEINLLPDTPTIGFGL